MNITPEALDLLPQVREALERQTVKCLCPHHEEGWSIQRVPISTEHSGPCIPECKAGRIPDPKYKGLLEVVKWQTPVSPTLGSIGWVGTPQGALAGAMYKILIDMLIAGDFDEVDVWNNPFFEDDPERYIEERLLEFFTKNRVIP